MRTVVAGVVGSLLPGLGHLLVGKRALGLAILVPTLAIITVVAAWAAAVGPFGVVAAIVAPGALAALLVVDVVVAIFRAGAGLDAARRTNPGRPALAATVVLVLLLVAVPHVLAARSIAAANGFLDSMFAPAATEATAPEVPALAPTPGSPDAAPADPAAMMPPAATPTAAGSWPATAPPDQAPAAGSSVWPFPTMSTAPSASASPTASPGSTASPGPVNIAGPWDRAYPVPVDDGSSGSLPALGVAVPWTAPGAIPWGDDGRFDLLLLGSDAGRDRWSRRTDVMLLVEVDVATGRVALIGLPRNLTNAPYPPGPARDGISCGCQPGLLNEMYVEASVRHPGRWPGSTPEVKGIGAVRAVVSEITGRPIDAVLVVDLIGVIRVVDAMGGVDITVPYAVEDRWYPDPILGDRHLRIPAGRQHMNGRTALAYARSRHQDSDYGRMARQQTLLLAIRDQIGPATLLSAPSLFEAARGTAWTDLPRESLPSLVELFGRAAHAPVAQLRIVPPAWSSALSRPEVDRIRRAIAALLPGTPKPGTATAPFPVGTPVPVATPTPPPATPSPAPTPPPAGAIASGDYRCLDVGTARDRIEADGFDVVAITPSPPGAAFYLDWIVVGQDPPPGTLLAPGAGIGIVVAAPGTACGGSGGTTP